MTISVVLTTYNGEKFVIEQLESIANQTLQPDEVLIFDDCSTDKTVEVIQLYIRNHSLNNFKLYKNEKNLGWQKNFIEGIKRASGDLIFLADQDDLWQCEKIHKMSEIMEKNSQINLLCSNYTILNQNGKKFKTQCKDDDNKLEKIQFTPRFHLVNRPGCTYCLRRDFAFKAADCWVEGLAHDKLFWVASSITESLYCINSPFICFRRHENNASGKGHIKDRNVRRILQEKDHDFFCKLCEKFSYSLNMKESHFLKIKNSYLEWSEARIKFLSKKSLSSLICCFFLRKFYSSNKSFLADVLE